MFVAHKGNNLHTRHRQTDRQTDRQTFLLYRHIYQQTQQTGNIQTERYIGEPSKKNLHSSRTCPLREGTENVSFCCGGKKLTDIRFINALEFGKVL